MAMHIKNDKVTQLLDELAQMTGESKTETIFHSLEERMERITRPAPGKRRLARALHFLETEIWPNIPPELLGSRVTRKERERILGYGRGDV